MPPRPATGDELGPAGRRWLTGGVLLAHLAGGWALLQVDAVRQAVAEVAPAIMVDMIAPVEPPKPAPPPPPSPPRKLAPAPTPLIAAAPTPAPAPPSFVVPVAEPAPPAPVLAAPAPPAPPAPPQAAPALKRIPASALRYLSQPRLNFPLLSKRARESGEVTLRIAVDAGGRLIGASVHKSSGFERLDQQALLDIRSARFVPHMDDGKPVDVETLAVLAYDL